MSKYVISVQAGEDCNPEFGPDKEMMDGLECDGFFMVGFKNGQPCFESMMGTTVNVLSKWIKTRNEGAQYKKRKTETRLRLRERCRAGAPI